MAAVAASLAAFLAGCGVPGLPGSLVARHPAEQEHELGGGTECHLGAEWSPKWQSGRFEITAVLVKVKALARKSNATGAAARPLAPVPALAACKPAVVEGLIPGACPPAQAVATAARAALRPRSRSHKINSRRVHFDLSQSTEHEITPYAEVYGVHPRDFNFARGRYAPAACFVDPHAPPEGGCSSDSDDDEDEALGRLRQWHVKSRGLLGMVQAPPHIW
eukprot:CAMPEP_0115280022 /NCGR_PEP_ID=MMETSP0270-20121206/58571_1 /TAXON_ID=71861 /ORGANISM="Scrippsiella trochoidea, Strain CCMP3099" /LENGTH=219 /DNA_ID=CAMNT_0002696741 /DNA_START=68 /DNA_END=724 /DNA_ORIENTATION=-